MKILHYDLETTGLKHWRNGIHQISGIIEIDGVEVKEFDFKVAPNKLCFFDEGAFKMKKVTIDEVKLYPSMEVVFKQFQDMLRKYVDPFNKKDYFFLAGYNISAFDNQFLRAWFEQNNNTYFGSWFWNSPIDTFCLASDVLKEERVNMPAFNLASVAKHLGIQVDESKLHEASYDVRLHKQIYETLKYY